MVAPTDNAHVNSRHRNAGEERDMTDAIARRTAIRAEYAAEEAEAADAERVENEQVTSASRHDESENP
jgi:hypothetical protein